MTSEEFRTNPLLLRNQFERSGTFEIPVIQKEKINLENLTLIGYDMVSVGMLRFFRMEDRFGFVLEMVLFKTAVSMKLLIRGLMVRGYINQKAKECIRKWKIHLAEKHSWLCFICWTAFIRSFLTTIWV